MAIPPDLHAEIIALCRRRAGIELKQVVRRVFSWFLRQEGPVQTAVLGIDDGMQASYADVLQAIVDELRIQERENENARGVTTDPRAKGNTGTRGELIPSRAKRE